MTPERWNQVKDHFGFLTNKPVEEYEPYLESIPDQEVAAEVRKLLEYHAHPISALDQPVPGAQQLYEALSSARRRERDGSARAFSIGDVVAGRFEIRALAGEGGMGEVYEAFDRELSLRVALKTLKSELAADARLVERFKSEIQNARAVSHPNVCRVFDFGRHVDASGDSICFCTMAFVEGEPLSQVIRSGGPVAIERLLEIAEACASALDAAHATGILHCDLKPANVLIGKDGVVHVTDFGLSRAWSSVPREAGGSTHTTGSIAIGTPAYMAPEQLRGEKPTPASDIYAFGVILYEMATGRTPYQGVSPVAMVAKKASELPESPKNLQANLPDGWDSVILRCVALQPGDRYRSASAAVSALRNPTSLKPMRARLWLGAAGVAGIVAAGSYLGREWFQEEDDTRNRWLQQGRLAIAENAPRRAAYLFEQRLAEGSDSVLARAYLAMAYARLDRLDAAKDQLLALDRRKRLATRTGQYVEAARAVVLRDWPSALKQLDLLLSSAEGQEILPLSLEKAAVLAEDGKNKLALDTNHDASSRFPNEPALLLQRAILLNRGGRKDEALQILRNAEASFRNASNPEGAVETLLLISRILQDTKDLTSASAVLDEATSLAQSNRLLPQQVQLNGARCILLIASGKRDQAESLAAQNVDLARRNDLGQLAASAENDLASAFLAQQRFEKAEIHFREAIRLAQPVKARQAEAQAHLNLCSTLTRQGRMKEALAEIEMGIRFYRQGNYRSQLESGSLLLAQANMNLGHNEDAARILAEVTGSSNKTIALKAREWLADLAAWRGNFKVAIEEKGKLHEVYLEMERAPLAAYMLFDQADFWVDASRPAIAEALLARARNLLVPLEKSVSAILDRGLIVESRLRISQGRARVAIRGIAAIASNLTLRESLRRPQVLSLWGELEARAGSTASGLARCEQVLAEAKDLEVVGVRVEVLGRLAIAAKLAGANDRMVEVAREVRQLSIRHGYRFWHLTSLYLLGQEFREEREQLIRTYGEDSEGPIGPRFASRADFRQIT